MKITKTQLRRIIKEEIEGLSIDEGVWDKIKGAVGMGKKEPEGAVGMGKKEPEEETDPFFIDLIRKGVARTELNLIKQAFAKGFPRPKRREQGYIWRIIKAWNAGDIDQGEAYSLALSLVSTEDSNLLSKYAPGSAGAKKLAAAERRDAAREKEREKNVSEMPSAKEVECKQHGKDYYWDQGRGECKKREKKEFYPREDPDADDQGYEKRRWSPWSENLERLKDIIREELEAIVKK